MVLGRVLGLWVAWCCLACSAIATAAPLRAAAPAHGVAVVARTAAARADAKGLARAVYADRRLRPALGEPLARALVGEHPAAGSEVQPRSRALPSPAEVLSTVGAVEGAEPAVARRLLASLGRDLGVELVVLVSHGPDAPVARVLRVTERRFLPLSLSPRPQPIEAGQSARPDWSDAMSILASALVRSRTTRRSAAPVAAPSAPADPAVVASAADSGGGSFDWLTSPWFWGGFGVVAAVGVTVIVLSQTTMNQPSTVLINGRVGP